MFDRYHCKYLSSLLLIILLFQALLPVNSVQDPLKVGQKFWFTPWPPNMTISSNNTQYSNDSYTTIWGKYPQYHLLTLTDNNHRLITVNKIDQESVNGLFGNQVYTVAHITDGNFSAITVMDGWIEIANFFLNYGNNRMNKLEDGNYTFQDLYHDSIEMQNLIKSLIMPYFISSNLTYYQQILDNYKNNYPNATNNSYNAFFINNNQFDFRYSFNINNSNYTNIYSGNSTRFYVGVEIRANLESPFVDYLNFQQSTDIHYRDKNGQLTYTERSEFGLNSGNQSWIAIDDFSWNLSLVLGVYAAIFLILILIIIYWSFKEKKY